MAFEITVPVGWALTNHLKINRACRLGNEVQNRSKNVLQTMESVCSQHNTYFSHPDEANTTRTFHIHTQPTQHALFTSTRSQHNTHFSHPHAANTTRTFHIHTQPTQHALFTSTRSQHNTHFSHPHAANTTRTFHIHTQPTQHALFTSTRSVRKAFFALQSVSRRSPQNCLRTCCSVVGNRMLLLSEGGTATASFLRPTVLQAVSAVKL